MTGCVGVDMVRLTDQTFPPKSSPKEVAVLGHDPQCAHLKLAELHVDDSTDTYQHMQDNILKKAAELGADAVVFGKSEKRTRHQVTYAPYSYGLGYSPWGYGAYTYPGWGYGGWYGNYGYGYGGTALPYDYTVRSLKGTAIRYTESSDRSKC
jgi:hypothetical protein